MLGGKKLEKVIKKKCQQSFRPSYETCESHFRWGKKSGTTHILPGLNTWARRAIVREVSPATTLKELQSPLVKPV